MCLRLSFLSYSLECWRKNPLVETPFTYAKGVTRHLMGTPTAEHAACAAGISSPRSGGPCAAKAHPAVQMRFCNLLFGNYIQPLTGQKNKAQPLCLGAMVPLDAQDHPDNNNYGNKTPVCTQKQVSLTIDGGVCGSVVRASQTRMQYIIEACRKVIGTTTP